MAEQWDGRPQNPGGWPDGAAHIEFIGEDEHGRRVARLAFPGTLPAVSCDTVWRGEPVLLLTPAEVEAREAAARREGIEAAAAAASKRAASRHSTVAHCHSDRSKKHMQIRADEAGQLVADIRALLEDGR